jgi:hypothetical protein
MAGFGASPESITTVCEYGFRARRFTPSRNDEGCDRIAADIVFTALYIRLARPRPGFWRWACGRFLRAHEAEANPEWRDDRAIERWIG